METENWRSQLVSPGLMGLTHSSLLHSPIAPGLPGPTTGTFWFSSSSVLGLAWWDYFPAIRAQTGRKLKKQQDSPVSALLAGNMLKPSPGGEAYRPTVRLSLPTRPSPYLYHYCSIVGFTSSSHIWADSANGSQPWLDTSMTSSVILNHSDAVFQLTLWSIASQRAEATPVLPALSRFAATRRSNVKATLISRSPHLIGLEPALSCLLHASLPLASLIHGLCNHHFRSAF